MPIGWIEAFNELSNFVINNPEIEIKPGMISIPGQHHTGFYERFDAARAAFITGKFQWQLDTARAIGNSSDCVIKDLNARLNLAGVTTPAAMKNYLQDPVHELSKGLLDPLFQVLKGQLSLQSFETESREWLKTRFESLNNQAYEELIALSLINALEPIELFQVEVEDSVRMGMDQAGCYNFDLRYAVTRLKKTTQLSFDHEQHPSLTTPDVIIYSGNIHRFVSLRPDFLQAAWVATNPAEGREWLPVDRSESLHRCILVYSASEPQDLTLVADAEKIDRPEVVIECWTENSDEKAHKLKEHYHYLCPRSGFFLVTAADLPDELATVFDVGRAAATVEPHAGKPLEPDHDNPPLAQESIKINILRAGFQPSALAAVVNVLPGVPENNTAEGAVGK